MSVTAETLLIELVPLWEQNLAITALSVVGLLVIALKAINVGLYTVLALICTTRIYSATFGKDSRQF